MTNAWLATLASVLIIPVIMVVIGLIIKRFPPKKINSFYGYRTPMSKKNEDTWRFANLYSAKLFLWIGLILIPVSVVPLLFLLKKSEDILVIASTVITAADVTALLASAIATEIALRKNFERDGSRRADIEQKS